MIRQYCVHLKLDNDLLSRLDRVCQVAGINRNKAINKMVDFCLFSCELQFEKTKRVHFFD